MPPKDELYDHIHAARREAAEASRPRTTADHVRSQALEAIEHNQSIVDDTDRSRADRTAARVAVAGWREWESTTLQAVEAFEGGLVNAAASEQSEWDEVADRYNAEHFPAPNLHDSVAALLRGEHPEPPPRRAKPTFGSLAAAGRVDLAARAFDESAARDPQIQRNIAANAAIRAKMGYDPDDRPWNKPAPEVEPEPDVEPDVEPESDVVAMARSIMGVAEDVE